MRMTKQQFIEAGGITWKELILHPIRSWRRLFPKTGLKFVKSK